MFSSRKSISMFLLLALMITQHAFAVHLDQIEVKSAYSIQLENEQKLIVELGPKKNFWNLDNEDTRLLVNHNFYYGNSKELYQMYQASRSLDSAELYDPRLPENLFQIKTSDKKTECTVSKGSQKPEYTFKALEKAELNILQDSIYEGIVKLNPVAYRPWKKFKNEQEGIEVQLSTLPQANPKSIRPVGEFWINAIFIQNGKKQMIDQYVSPSIGSNDEFRFDIDYQAGNGYGRVRLILDFEESKKAYLDTSGVHGGFFDSGFELESVDGNPLSEKEYPGIIPDIIHTPWDVNFRN